MVAASAIAIVTAAPSAKPPPPTAPCEPGSVVSLDQFTEPVLGSFSAAGRDEVAGEMACEGATGFALARRAGVQLALARFDLRVDPRTSRSRCRALRTGTGRDLLICRDDAIAYGQHDQAVVAVDYARDEDHDRIELVAVSDTTDTSCGGGPDVVAAELEGFDLVDVDGDGALDVRVRVRAARARVPPRPNCVMGSLGSGDPPKVPRPRLWIVELLLRGETLVPTPGSARVLAALAALKR